jgi:hypothetical protein
MASVSGLKSGRPAPRTAMLTAGTCNIRAISRPAPEGACLLQAACLRVANSAADYHFDTDFPKKAQAVADA